MRARWRLTPWWMRVLLVFAVSRVITTTLLAAFAGRQPANAWTGAAPDYFSFATLWDGTWYLIIALSGYPSELPRDDEGYVAENAWAFMPVYPAVVRGVMLLSGAPFAVAAVTVSVLCAAGAALLFHRLLVRVLPASTAMFGVVLFCVAPLSPILQVAYAESMHLLLLTLALLLLLRRQYWWMLPVVVVASLTRPSGLALALALGLHVVWRWWRRRDDPFPPREAVAAVTATAVSVVAGFAWLLVAAAVTGSLTAYTDTELAWRAPYVGRVHLVPFTPWVQGANWWLGEPLGAIALVAVVLVFAAALATPAVRRLGPDLLFWIVAYSLYLLAVFFPQSSTFRLLVPLFPLLGALAQPRSLTYRVALVLVCIAGQAGWIHLAWWVDGYDWTPP